MNKPTEKIITDLLMSTKRYGMKNLIRDMQEREYFTTPASKSYHNNFKGGLMLHSFNVYTLFWDMCNSFNIDIKPETAIICGLLHDLCKLGNYIEVNGEYECAPSNNFKKHSVLSIKRIEKFIILTVLEKEIIQFHMGFYGTKEFNSFKGEYTLSELVKVFNKNKLAKLFYFCDDMSSQFMEFTK